MKQDEMGKLNMLNGTENLISVILQRLILYIHCTCIQKCTGYVQFIKIKYI